MAKQRLPRPLPRIPRRKALHHAVIEDGRTMREIAEEAGLSSHEFSMIVRGLISEPRPETRAAIAAVLDTDERLLFPECFDDGSSAAWDAIAAELTASRS